MNPITNHEPMSKERPILFSGPMVRAILNGTKTQTRRIVKPQPVVRYGGHITEGYYAEGGAVFKEGGEGGHRPMRWCEGAGFVPSRLGKPGDKLWVRETHHVQEFEAIERDGVYTPAERFVSYRADSPMLPVIWKPSIFMPRWASRITLEVTEVRVERLQDISEEDAKAEGADPVVLLPDDDTGLLTTVMHDTKGDHRDGFAALWSSINGLGSWQANPWVWVIDFRLLNQTGH